MNDRQTPPLTDAVLSRSLEAAEAHGLFDRLNQLHGTLRSGSCAGCARCCAESVNAFYIEFLAIRRRLDRDPTLKARLMPRILRHYLLEMVAVMPCPFLDEDRRCAVYEERPLVCRQFGHWSRRDFQRNAEAVKRQNRAAAAYYRKNHGLMLPEAVVNQGLTYCEAFTVPHKTGPLKRGEQTDAVFALDMTLLGLGCLDETLMGTPLVTWFVYTLYSPGEAGRLRLQVMKEYLENGSSQALEDALSALSAE